MADILDRRTPDATGQIAARPRVGVVLAAGRSERLASVTGGRSKAVVRVGGLSLVERAIRTLLTAGIRDVVVVVGYEAGPVAAVAKRVAPGAVRTVFAERWELGNGVSLAAAEPFVTEEDLFVLVTADHVFGDGALEPLLQGTVPAVLVDHAPDRDAWEEGTRVRLDGERAIAFSKELADPSIDCGAFVLPRAVFAAQRRAESAGDASLAGAVTELVAATGITAVELAPASWWQDIDTPADLRRARRMLRASLSKPSDGPVSRYLNRPISTRVSFAIAPLRPSPDLVSFLAFAVTLAGAWLIGRGGGILGGILVQLSSVLDGVDGELARIQLRTSAAGALLDGVLDRLGDAAAVAAAGLWALDQGHDPGAVVALVVAATAGAMLSMAVKDRITSLGIPPPPERLIGWLLGGRDARLLVLAVAVVVGSPMTGLVVVVATSALTLLVRTVFARMAVHMLERPLSRG
jgi:1L-myo-inositol 1-phosphate cytidylyltransferase / CDP-L-myo-inositol myo-inositolphosphotransferase